VVASPRLHPSTRSPYGVDARALPSGGARDQSRTALREVSARLVPMIEEAETLYGLEPSAFIAARDRLVKVLRADGRRAEASDVARLRRPLLAEHALNQVARTQASIAQSWSDAVATVERAQHQALGGSQGGAAAFRAATAELRAATALLVDAAVRSLGDVKDRDTRRHDIVTIVRALTSQAGAAVLRRGVIGAEQVDQTELFAGPADPPVGAPTKQPDVDRSAARRATATRQSDETSAVRVGNDALRAARERDDALRVARSGLDAEIEAAADRAGRAAAAVTAASDAVADAVVVLDAARARLAAADGARDAADHELLDLQRRRDELPATPHAGNR
jgi:hypothetical protein